MKKSIKQLLSLLIIQLTLLSCSCSLKKQEYHSESINGVVRYDYSLGKVYISESIEDLNDNGVNILDLRYTSNPSMRVIESCNIKDVSVINEIIGILDDYNCNYNYNLKWKRSNLSMEIEWILHNLLYDMGFYVDHTNDVDFNNNEFKNILKMN